MQYERRRLRERIQSVLHTVARLLLVNACSKSGESAVDRSELCFATVNFDTADDEVDDAEKLRPIRASGLHCGLSV
jgi:hypothetical protein